MEPVADDSPLVVVLGPTASGKSALAMELARRFDGEIIAADSRTVYKGMDIATAKPTAADQREVPHHLIDVVTPGDPFSVADFQRLANRAVVEISERGRLPILVGGSGLYIDAVIYDFSFRQPANPELRRQLEELSVEELQQLLEERGIALPHNQRNPRHLIRSLETSGALPQRGPLRPRTLVIGLNPGPDVLRQKITQRIDAMVEEGLIEEARQLSARYGWDTPALQAPGYKAFRPYLAGAVSLDHAKQLFVQYDTQYAKRQQTWFKRNRDVQWISNLADAVALVTTLLNN